MSSASINLTFINNSDDQNNSQVVVFQKNVATNFGELAVAWKVIQNCGAGWQNSFEFPMVFQIGAQDAYGNSIINPIEATNGNLYSVSTSLSGDSLGFVSASNGPSEVQVRNDLAQGGISAMIYKNGRLLAIETGISPRQKAVFQFKPTIWIGVVSGVYEGQIMDDAILMDVNYELGLLGVASANIVMTGGGTGPNASPFKFSLQNIVYA